MIKHLDEIRGDRITRIEPDILSVPDDVWDDVAKAHPRFAQYVELRRNRPDRRQMDTWVEGPNVGPPGSCGDTPSAFRNFIFSLLKTLLSHKDRLDPEQVVEWNRGWETGPIVQPEPLVAVDPSPWKIISLDVVEELIHSLGSEMSRRVECDWDPIKTQIPRLYMPGWAGIFMKNSYSAASVAIRFLESLSPDSRMSIRSMVLNEDHRSVAFPECHGLGLIPYCRENTRLRIDRRVSMWRTVFQSTVCHWDGGHNVPYFDAKLEPNHISYRVAAWIVEALELEAAGMPRGCFTLTLDGDSTCSEIFQTVVRRDAAWQTAIDLCLERNILPAVTWDFRRRDTRNIICRSSTLSYWAGRNKWYLFEAFPQAIEDILAGSSVVKCSFDLGDAWGETCDVERLIEKNKSKTMDEWKEAWYVRDKESYDPDPPSPNWIQLLCDRSLEPVLPIPYDDGL